MAVSDPRFAVSRFDALPGPLETVTLVLEGELTGTVLREPVRLVVSLPDGGEPQELPTVGRTQQGDGAWSLRFAGAMPPPGTRFGLALGRWLRIALPEPDIGAPQEADARYTELAREVNRLRHTLDAAQLEQQAPPPELTTLRRELEQRDRRIAELSAERTRLAAAGEAEAPLLELSGALEAEQARVQELTAALAAAHARVDELSSAYDALHSHAQQLGSGQEAAQSAHQAQVEQLTAQLQQLTAAQQEAHERIEALTASHQAEHERTERVRGERDALQQRLDASDGERAEVDGELEMARREINEALATLERERGELTAMREQLAAARRDRTEALVALERAKVLPEPQTGEGRRRSAVPEEEAEEEPPPVFESNGEDPTTERQLAPPPIAPQPDADSHGDASAGAGEFVRVLTPHARRRSTGQLDADGAFVGRDTAAIGARHIKPAELRRRHHVPSRRSGGQPPLLFGAIAAGLICLGLLLALLLILAALF